MERASARAKSQRCAARAILCVLAALWSACADRPDADQPSLDASTGGQPDIGALEDSAKPEDSATSQDTGPGIALPDVGGADASQAQDSGASNADGGSTADTGGTVAPDTGATTADTAQTPDVGGSVDATSADGTGSGVDGGGGVQCPGGAGCACTADVDCTIGICLLTAGKLACAKPCVSGNNDCGEGTSCKQVQQPDGAVFLCVASDRQACDPCTASSQCEAAGGPNPKDNACVLHGVLFGSFCGISCTSTSDCPGGFTCEGALSIESKFGKQCVPQAAGGQLARIVRVLDRRQRRGLLHRVHPGRGRRQGRQAQVRRHPLVHCDGAWHLHRRDQDRRRSVRQLRQRLRRRGQREDVRRR